MVVRGAQVPALQSVAAGDVVAFSWVNGWNQVPVQVDERKQVDLGTVYNGPPPASSRPSTPTRTPSPAPTRTRTWTPTTRSRSGPWTPASRRRATRTSPAGTVAGSGVKLSVSTFIDGKTKKAWIYLFKRSGNLSPGAGKQLRELRLQPAVRRLQDDLQAPGRPEPRELDGHHALLHGPLLGPLAQRPAQDHHAGSSGVDILDRAKAQFAPGNCGRTEDTFNDAEGAFIANKSGPVRAIRSYIGANSGPLTQREHIFYERRQDIRTFLRVHAIPGIMDYFDYSPAATGMTYRNNANTGGVRIDGVPDTPTAGSLAWETVDGDQGGLSIVHTDPDRHRRASRAAPTTSTTARRAAGPRPSAPATPRRSAAAGRGSRRAIPNTDPRTAGFKQPGSPRARSTSRRPARRTARPAPRRPAARSSSPSRACPSRPTIALQQVVELARVDAVLALVGALRLVVEQGQHQLLARRAEAAGRAVEPAQRDALHDPLDPTDRAALALLARIADLDRLRLEAASRRPRSRRGPPEPAAPRRPTNRSRRPAPPGQPNSSSAASSAIAPVTAKAGLKAASTAASTTSSRSSPSVSISRPSCSGEGRSRRPARARREGPARGLGAEQPVEPARRLVERVAVLVLELLEAAEQLAPPPSWRSRRWRRLSRSRSPVVMRRRSRASACASASRGSSVSRLANSRGASSILSVGGSAASSTSAVPRSRASSHLLVELGGHQRRERHQRQRDARVAQRQQRGRLAARALGEQLAGKRRVGHAHAEAREQLRQRASRAPTPRGGRPARRCRPPPAGSPPARARTGAPGTKRARRPPPAAAPSRPPRRPAAPRSSR